MELELISFNLCPFVQRSVITLLYHQMPYRITYIDLDAPPDWFLSISPFGKVPVLRVGGQHILFESAVINEFIDEVSPGSMQPGDPLQRALNRAWIEFGSACLTDSHNLVTAKDEEGFGRARDALGDKFRRLETMLAAGPYFNGERFSLVDTSYAPLFMRLAIIGGKGQAYSEEAHPNITAWSRALLSLPVVGRSVVPGFRDLYLDFIRSKRGFLAGLLG